MIDSRDSLGRRTRTQQRGAENRTRTGTNPHLDELNRTFFVLAGWMIDGTGGRIQRDVLLEIREGYIFRITSVDAETLRLESVLDLSHCTLLPGLVDCHVHLVMSGTSDPDARKQQLKISYGEAKSAIAGRLSSHLNYGVVAVRDGGDKAGHTLRFREEMQAGGSTQVRLRLPGKAWHTPGRYGSLIGRVPPEGHTLEQSIRKLQNGTDHIKIVNSGLNSLRSVGLETPPQFDSEHLRDAFQAGKMLGLRTMVHANGKTAVRSTIEAGCHSIEHGFFMGDENLKRMAESGITWVPTAFTMEAYSRMLNPSSIEAEVARKTLDHHLHQISHAERYGVQIAVGTDAGSLGVHHGRAVWEEIKILTNAGFSLEMAIRSAASLGASLLGLQHDLGGLRPHFPATFVAFEGSPEKLLSAPRPAHRVCVGGEMCRLEPTRTVRMRSR